MPFPSDMCESSISYESSQEIKRTVYHSKNTRQRFLRQNRNDNFSVSYQVSSSKLSEFESFIVDDISLGADTFQGPYFDGVEQTGTLEIINGRYNVRYVAQDLWDLSYSFQVKDRDFTEAQTLYEMINDLADEIGDPEDVFDLFNALSSLVNNNKLVS